MAPRTIPSEASFEAYEAFANSGLSAFENLKKSLSELNGFVDRDEIVRNVALSFSDQESSAIASFLLDVAISNERGQNFFKVNHASFSNLIESDEAFPENTGSGIKKTDLLSDISQLKCLVLIAKSIDILYHHERVFNSCRIFTDLRPVFDENKVAGYGIVSSLEMSFEMSDDEHTMLVALDRSDILELKNTLDRALEKIDSMQSDVKSFGYPLLKRSDN